jgi:hypothetical protein
MYAQRYTPDAYPASIDELARRLNDSDYYDKNRELKYHLLNVEDYRRSAEELVDFNDLANAYVQFGKAATLVIEKLPTHRDYHFLTTEHRQSLAQVRVCFLTLASYWYRLWVVVQTFKALSKAFSI